MAKDIKNMTTAELETELERIDKRLSEIKKEIRQKQFDALPAHHRAILTRLGCNPKDDGKIIYRTTGIFTAE